MYVRWKIFHVGKYFVFGIFVLSEKHFGTKISGFPAVIFI